MMLWIAAVAAIIDEVVKTDDCHKMHRKLKSKTLETKDLF